MTAIVSRKGGALPTFPMDNDARNERFTNNGEHERFLQSLKAKREKDRKDAISSGLMLDPKAQVTLEDAITLRGTCMTMCPEYEMYTRQNEHAVDPLEMAPGTNQIDPDRAVKRYHRSAAGDDTEIPNEVRPPTVLQMTLNYLINDLLAEQSLPTAHSFLRDRTRSIRQDFTLQNENGALAIECHERIVRFHILSLFELQEQPGFEKKLELEQLKKALQSLIEFYDDARSSNMQTPNQAEFRAYHLLVHIRDPDVARQIERQPPFILDAPMVQTALELRRFAQQSPGMRTRLNASAGPVQNYFTRFFKTVAQESVHFLMACLVQISFFGIRKAALRAMKTKYRKANRSFPVATLTEMLGCDDDNETTLLVKALGLPTEPIDNSTCLGVKLISESSFNDSGAPPPHKSKRLVEAKRGSLSDAQVINGELPVGYHTPLVPLFTSVVQIPAAATFAPPAPLPISFASHVSPFGAAAKQGGRPSTSAFTPSVGTTAIFNPPPSTTMFPSNQFATFSRSAALPPAPAALPSAFLIPPSLPSTITPSPLAGRLNAQAPAFVPRSSSNPSIFGHLASPVVSKPPTFIQPTPPSESPPTFMPPTPPLTVRVPPRRAPSLTLLPPAIAHSPLIRSSLSLNPPSMPSPGPSRTPSLSVSSPLRESSRISFARSPSPVAPEPTPTPPLPVERAKSQKKKSSLIQPPILPPKDLALEARVKEATDRVFKEMVSNALVFECAAILADQQHRRFAVRSAFQRWHRSFTILAEKKMLREKGRQMIKQAMSHLEASSFGRSSRTSHRSESEPEDERQTPSTLRQRPIDDEEFAHALDETRIQRDRLWARGTFLDAIRARILQLNRPLLPDWQVWLSTASPSEEDPTTQWLLRKFDMDSSHAISEAHGLSARCLEDEATGSTGSYGPGVIAFEVSRDFTNATSVEESDRLWEQEYQRLNNVLESLPANRTYMPTILLIAWSGEKLAPEMLRVDIVQRMKDAFTTLELDRVLEGFRVLVLTSADKLETVFQEGLSRVYFDLSGKVIQSVAIEDFIAPFVTAWRFALDRGLGLVTREETVNWPLYGHLFQLMVALLNDLSKSVWEVVQEADPASCDPPMLPTFLPHIIEEEQNMYQAVLDYLTAKEFLSFVTVNILRLQLQHHFDYHDAFPLREALESLASHFITETTLSAGLVDIRASNEHEKRVARFKDLTNEGVSHLEAPAMKRKRRSKDDESTPKRLKPDQGDGTLAAAGPIQASVQSSPPKTPVSAAMLLQAIREAREKHRLSS